MAFDLHITIQENSPVGQAVQRMMVKEQYTPEQAATVLMTAGARIQTEPTPAQEMLGAFSTAEDIALLDEVMDIVHSRRAADVPRDFGL